MKLIAWLNDPYDLTLHDVADFAFKAQGHNAQVRLIQDARLEPHGAAAVIFEPDGFKGISDAEIADLILAERAAN